jgi:DUF4097 and DUF4098 domain-containing protein YvlB
LKSVYFMYSLRPKNRDLIGVGLLLLALSTGAITAFALSEEARVKWNEPTRQGYGWMRVANCSLPLRDGTRLVLRTDFGFVNVRASDSNRLDCHVRLMAYTPDLQEATRYLRSFAVSISQREGTVYVFGKSSRGQARKPELRAEFELAVPTRFNVEIETQAGDVSVGRLQGQLRVSTGGGDIRSGDIAGPVKVETAIGNITLGNLGQRLEASTRGGSIRVGNVKGAATLATGGGEIIAGLIDGPLDAHSAGGDIVLRGAAGPLSAETEGGQIQIGDCGSAVRAETEGGNIRLQSAGGMVKAQTGGGSIDLFEVKGAVHAISGAGSIVAEISADKQTFANSHIETSVGDVEVFLPADLPLNVQATIDELAGQKIVSDFPLSVQGGDDQDFGLGALRGEGALNGGGKRLVIHTLMGNIEIRRLDTQVLSHLRQRQEMYWSRWQGLEDNILQRHLLDLRARQMQVEDQQRNLLRQEQLRKVGPRQVDARK